MSITRDDLNRLHDFAVQRIDCEGAEDPYELVDQWETNQLTDEQLRRNADAIQKSIDDMEAGDTGRPVREILANELAGHDER